jgi:hypothetical protein
MGSGCGGSDNHQYYSDYCENGDLSDCTSDEQCDDHVFCNGVERCNKTLPGADPCGCAHSTPACGAGDVCIEGTQRCESPACADADGDGHHAAACGGDDCDDNDANRFPGNPEVCDNDGHDEDCDATTFGLADADGDQFYNAFCCNTESSGARHCGTDCDDTNPAIVPGAQKCEKGGSTTVVICDQNGTFRAPVQCGGALTCVTQPNGLGVCE